MFKGIKVNNLLSYKKVLLILLFVMLFIPKTAFAFTVTYKTYGGKFADGSRTNVVEYDNDKNIVSGTYKEPTILNSCGDKIFTGWFTDETMKNQYYLRDNNTNITVYAGFNKYSLCYTAIEEGQKVDIWKNGNYKIELWGAQGGDSSRGTAGGLGAYTSGNVDLTKNTNLYVYVSPKNNNLRSPIEEYGVYGFNGSSGGNFECLNVSYNGGYNVYGGGATDVRLVDGLWDNTSSLASRIMVASGGSGSAEWLKGTPGGALNGISNSFTTGATQTNGGGPISGTFGKAAWPLRSSTCWNSIQAGSGGGYYGGSASNLTGRLPENPDSNNIREFSQASGSSYISGYTGSVAITSENNLTPRLDSNNVQCEDGTTDNLCSVHYSGIVFSNPVMKAGNEDMPVKTLDNTTMNGNSGDGYSRFSTTEETFHTVTFKHTGEDDFTVYVIEGEKVVRPNVYLTANTGYTLHTWEIDGTTTEWDFDDPVTEDLVLNSYVTLDIYNITYNVTGGTVSGNPDTYTVEDLPITLNNPTPEQVGYIFTGWTGTGLTEKTMNVTIPINSTGDREYTSHIEKEKYTITYNLNGGELETGVTNPEEYYIDTPDITLNNPSKEGYTFIGWTGSNGTTPTNVIIASGSTGNKTYTANYQIDRHTATFDSNLGTTAVPETITKDYNEALGTLPTTSRTGYIFEGWFTEKESGTQISSTTKMPASNPTYYAHWTPITYTIHFNSNNGTGSMADETMTYGVSKALTENTFTRDGWTFAGWNTKADSSGTNYIDKQEIFNLTDVDGEEFTLFAKWTKDEYIINYDADGGQLDNPKTTYSVDDEEFILVQPTKEGYTFTGWTGTGVTNPTKNVVIPTGSTGNRNYTAHWTATVYTIEYINNVTGETVLVAGNPTSYTVEDSDITLNNAGDYDTYHFYVGWTSDKDTESDLSDSYVIRTNQMKNLKIYAIYQTSPYTVSFDSDGGNDIDPISREGTEDIGPLPTPVRDGYTFKGWFVNNKLIDQTFHSRVDVTAIAKWEKIPDPVEPTIINPKTGDNIMKYLVLLLVSLIGLGYTGYKFKLKTKKTQ